jgi:hypothetical protein
MQKNNALRGKRGGGGKCEREREREREEKERRGWKGGDERVTGWGLHGETERNVL